MPNWNEQQRRAVELRNQNIIVSASAGSGKTTVLVGRLMDLVLKDRIRVDQILAMTFTEAAANEMKKRLSAALRKESETCTDTETKAFLLEQITLLQNAQISTIHSFCLSIVQSYYYIIGCSAQQVNHIADNASMERFRAMAMETTLEKYQGEALTALAQLFSFRIEETKDLKKTIIDLAALSASRPDPDAWLEKCLQAYQISSFDELPHDIQEAFYAYLSLKQTQILQALSQMLQLFVDEYSDKAKPIETILLKKERYQQASLYLETKDYENYRRAFLVCSGLSLPRTPNKDDMRFAAYKKEITDSEDALAAILYEKETLLKDMQSAAPFVSTLIQCMRIYQETYQSLKQEAQMIDFDDMEHFALQILQANDRVIAKEYQKQFSIIMVDEFQDTNDIQDTIISLIARKNNVFRVGDIKQSIYGFRHARPSIMQSYMDHPQPQDTVIYLSNNYRSSETLVEFNNVFYEQLMNLDYFASSYRQADHVQIGGDWQKKSKVPVQFYGLLIDELKTASEEFRTISRNQLKALWIASTIQKMKEERNLAWKDFVVLVRSNHSKDDLRSAFDRLHLPYFIEIKHGFYQSSAVELILSYLRFLRDPEDDIAFAAIALSPLFDLDDNTLALAKCRRSPHTSFYHYFLEHPFKGIDALIQILDQKELPIHTLLSKMYDQNDFYSYRTSLQEKTNLDLLYQQAVQFEQEHSSDLHAFIDYIDSIQDAQSAEANPISPDEDVIRAMSIHQSKGLQFPIVFLWSNDSQDALDFRSPFLFDADMGIGIRYMDPNRFLRTTIARIAIQHKKDREQLEEEMRILYVATTRAQNEMYIVDCIRSPQKFEQPLTSAAVFSRCGYTGWLLRAFAKTASPLFQVIWVHEPFALQPLSIQKKQAEKHKLYAKETYAINSTSASAIKKGKQFPVFLPNDTQAGAKRGSLLHEIVSQLHPPFKKEEIIHLFDQTKQEMTAIDLTQLLALGKNTQYIEWSQYPTVYHELPYSVQIQDQLLYGYIDFFAMNEQEIIILDYKSDHLDAPAAFIELYQAQLQTYADAMQQLYPHHLIHTWIYSFYLQCMIPVPLY